MQLQKIVIYTRTSLRSTNRPLRRKNDVKQFSQQIEFWLRENNHNLNKGKNSPLEIFQDSLTLLIDCFPKEYGMSTFYTNHSDEITNQTLRC